MKVVIAPDSFKGTMTSREAAEAMRLGVADIFPEAETLLLPVGDGGEGTADAIAASLGDCRRVECLTADPLGRPVEASYFVHAGKTAIIESAAASGLNLVAPGERDILRADTYGTGLLIVDAWRRGTRDFKVCMGGTATCDAGFGAFRAFCLESMVRPLLTEGRIELLCDVDNPLCGLRGAAAVFGPQKGAAPDTVPLLDSILHERARHYASLSGIDVTDMKYAGAAGGLAGMMMACVGAVPVSGIDRVLALLDFNRQLEGADLILTGEGKADATTLAGKAAKGILDAARPKGIPVILVAGRVADSGLLLSAGFSAVAQATPETAVPTSSPGLHLRRAVKDALRAFA